MPTATLSPFDHGVCAAKGYFKPLRYPFAFEAYQMQKQMEWLPQEVPMAMDIKDWHEKLSPAEKNQLTQLFRFFTTGDVDIGQAYLDQYIPVFKNEEVRMMLATFASMEAVHAHAYSLLLDSVGMPEVEYQAFRSYAEMAAKHDYVSSFNIQSESDVARAMAVFSAFTEGLQLFSTFAILLSYARGDLPTGARMKGMTQIVTWSVRDESLHVESMLKLFHTYIQERPHLWTEQLRQELVAICRKMVELEDHFIDLAFEMGDVNGLSATDVKQYVRYIADRRLEGLHLNPIFGVANPLKWLDHILNGVEHTNFFENRATEYAKGTLKGSWSDVWARFRTPSFETAAALPG
jgi:ribonucleoside-diphosphate reductase beta chain